jgi:hypothetical protein
MVDKSFRLGPDLRVIREAGLGFDSDGLAVQKSVHSRWVHPVLERRPYRATRGLIIMADVWADPLTAGAGPVFDDGNPSPTG